MEDSPAYAEIEFTQTYHDALQKISGALCSVSLTLTQMIFTFRSILTLC